VEIHRPYYRGKPKVVSVLKRLVLEVKS